MIGAIILKTMMDATGSKPINSRNVEELLSHWSDDAVLVYPGNLPFSGEIRGKEMLTVFFEIYMEQFPKLEFTTKNTFISNMYSLGLSNKLATEIDVTYTNQFGHTFHNSVMSSLEIKGGKLVYDKDFYYDIDQLNQAWEGADLSRLEKYLT
ncbi:Uncharacterised protein [BD1-7 clade bacterium]|uniref:SnoaL-like domain-containing protein n=1 Tax=BD1-7 clade bacterium TaxID=2029982 RepID=A0A5S9R0Q7_9GAMM|nr:Uncharacterised protein [BD1-7 clade bacterium]